MAFKKDQRVRGKVSDCEYRIESGPHLTGGGLKGYLVERMSDGAYFLQNATSLVPTPPRQGDRGNIKIPNGRHEYYGPYRLVYIDSQVILTEDRLGDYDTWQGTHRQQLLDGWEPIDG